MFEVSINKEINKERTQIMGIASIGVIIVHSIRIIEWPLVLKKFLGFGGIGVYVFVFLSAIGLYKSLKLHGGGGV